jgi:hypothetical protein
MCGILRKAWTTYDKLDLGWDRDPGEKLFSTHGETRPENTRNKRKKEREQRAERQ